jgi:hypothetical protein
MQDNSNINTIHLGIRSQLRGRSQCHHALPHCWATHKNESNSGKFEVVSYNLDKPYIKNIICNHYKNRHRISVKYLK